MYSADRRHVSACIKSLQLTVMPEAGNSVIREKQSSRQRDIKRMTRHVAMSESYWVSVKEKLEIEGRHRVANEEELLCLAVVTWKKIT